MRLNGDGSTSMSVDGGVQDWTGQAVDKMTGLIKSADALDEIADCRGATITFFTDVGQGSINGKFSEEMADEFHHTASRLRRLFDLQEICFHKNIATHIGEASKWSPEEMFYWFLGRKVLHGELVEISLSKFSLTAELEQDLGKLLEDGVAHEMIMANTPLFIDAFGAELCALDVDLYIAGYGIEIAPRTGNQTEVTLVRREGSALFMRAAGPMPFADPRGTAIDASQR